MSDSREVNEYNYSSGLGNAINLFIEQKRSAGFLYNSEAKMFYRFDKYLHEISHPDCTLPREVFEHYTAKMPQESKRNHRARLLLISQFSKFLKKMEIESYVPTHSYKPEGNDDFVPYIFMESELKKLFSAADTFRLHSRARNNSKLEQIIPVIYRLLYGGGFRISELTHLQLKDVDTKNGIISIFHSKFGNSRIVPICDTLNVLLKDYTTKVHADSCEDAIYFPNPDGERYSERSFYENFRQLLWKAEISHGGRGKGPRMHDLRHTFAVHCLKKWAKSDTEISIMLPFLSAYLGHSGIAATQRYLRLTADMFPYITEKLENLYGGIIPVIGGEFHV